MLGAVVIGVAFLIKPSAIVAAVIGFVPAGLLLAAAAPRSKVLWAALVPAWYLPAHTGTAVLKSVVNSLLGNEASLRTDPPPTAAIVPLVMVACAIAGGVIARALTEHRSGVGEAGGQLVEER